MNSFKYNLKITLPFLAMMLLTSIVRAAPVPADILWVVDTSGSMGGDITEVKNRIGDFNTAMVNNGIDAHYGLVEFGGNSGNGSTSGSPTLFQDITDFATFDTAGNPFDKLSASGGGDEPGSEAGLLGLNNANFRSGSVINIILVTDEDDDSDTFSSSTGSCTTLTICNNFHNALTANDALFNVIRNPGFGNTANTYDFLASNHGGTAFDILAFRNDPQPFFDNFINTKVQEIKDAAAPEPTTLALLGLSLVALRFGRRRVTG